MLYEEGFTQNREISWLRYNERVLEEALDDTVPLFERLRFISIFTSNLEEFFKVRVGSLLGETDEGDDDIDEKSGMTAQEQLNRIHSLIPGLLMKKDMAYGLVESQLAEKGIKRLEPWNISEEDRGACFDFFRDELKPRLKTLVLSKGDKLPYLDENRTYLIADLDAELEDRFGLVDIPYALPKIFVLEDEAYEEEPDFEDDIPRVSSIIGISVKHSFRYVLSEDIIRMFADTLFVPFVPLSVHCLDIARTSEVAPESVTANTASEMRKILKKRKYASADKLITDGKLSRNLKDYLAQALSLTERQMFTTTRIDFSYLSELEDKIPEDKRDGLLYPPHIPYDQTEDIEISLIDEIRRRDILSCYPYDSMDVFLGLLREAAFSREVREIRITIYRLASNPKITDYLIYAARNGKKVRVVLELRARFDEEKNLAWAERLKAAGCRVYYGIDKYKVHSKLCQIVFDDGYITNISTGNYNEKTAKLYTDLSILTSDPEIGKAASRLFKDICKEKIGDKDYSPLLVAPVSMRKNLLKLIKREGKKGKDGLIFLKMNSLSDDKLIEALMEASCRGCQIRMIVRGICCMLPGVDNATENVCIVNKVGRFLEHSRVYIFGSGRDEVMYISSADFMPRNMDKRVELACPVRDIEIKNRIREEMQSVYMDMDKGRVLTQEGKYVRKSL